MKTNIWRRFGALLATAGLAGSLLATVVAPGIALGAVDPGCTTLGGDDAPGRAPSRAPWRCRARSPSARTSSSGRPTSTPRSGVTLNVTGNMMANGAVFEADDDNSRPSWSRSRSP